MEKEFNLMLPLGIIIKRGAAVSPVGKAIVKGFVNKVHELIPQQPKLTPDQKDQLASICPKLAKIEPTLAGEIQALIDEE